MALKKSLVPQSVYRRQLAARLRELREQAGLSLAEAGTSVEINPASLSRIENGERGTTPLLVKALLECYEVHDPAIRDDLLDLVRADRAQGKPWWRKYSAVLSPTHYDGFLALEASATSLRTFEPQLVPGLLQTPEYAEAVISGMRLDLAPRQVKALVEVRMNRQRERLSGDAPVRLSAIVDETALRRAVGSPQIMRNQLKKLVDAYDFPHVRIQLLPSSCGAHPGFYGSFVLMGFPEPNPDVVWLEIRKSSLYLEAQDDVDGYADIFDRLGELALSPSESRTRIQHILKELPR